MLKLDALHSNIMISVNSKSKENLAPDTVSSYPFFVVNESYTSRYRIGL